MPISGVLTWLPTIDEFLAHWQSVNDALGLNPLVLLGGYARANLVTDRGNLATQLTNVEGLANLRQTAMGTRDLQRAGLRPRFLQFGPAVRGQLPGTRYIPAIPKTPQLPAGPGKWSGAMDDMSNLWTAINTNTPPITGFTPPLTLAGMYNVATFGTDSGNLKTAFTGLITADQNAQVGREQRDNLFEPIYQRLKQYRQAVIGKFPPGDPLIDSLPLLTPPAGATPDAVNASGVWDPGASEAVISHTASSRTDLDHYSLRYHPGPRYRASEEQVVANQPPELLEFHTVFGLVASGSVAFFKVYVVTDTGNEKGSNVVRIQRP